MTEPRVAAAGGGDAAGIAQLIGEVYGPLATGFAPTALRWTEQSVRPAQWLTARVGGRLVGVVRHEVDPEGYTFDALAVHPSARRRGVGAALVAAVERAAAAAPAERTVIAVRDSLHGNIAFFTGLGYTRGRPYPSAHHLYWKRMQDDRRLPGIPGGIR